ncbi:MAG: dTDP-4-dehydrorhamnose reductase [Desulfobacterales bacterium]|nr:dTDP-4-dehydrorhamnose reductase [Desulfobacterales bacterium]
MRILLIGANGQIGWELIRKCTDYDIDIIALNHQELDITDPAAVRNVIFHTEISLVINTAAYTAVDRAEAEPRIVFAVNRDGPGYLASCCSEIDIPLIHISTDYVFDGRKTTPYIETDVLSPLGIYGKSKAEGEIEIAKRLKKYIILRTAWLYGIHGTNFVKTMLHLGRKQDVIRVVSDQYGCPTYAADAAETILNIMTEIIKGRDDAWGLYHYCGEGVVSWHGFAEAVFELARKYDSFEVKKVINIPTDEYFTPAKRPAYSVLDCTLINQKFGIRPRPWRDSLAEMLARRARLNASCRER